MAYEAKTWECGEYITDDDLNHMEGGIAQASAQADDVSTRLATAENDINVLDARMDTFTSLPSGSTSGDAELIDIRVGADGKTYESAGSAVRGQISDLKSDISNVVKNNYEITDNLVDFSFDYNEWVQGAPNVANASFAIYNKNPIALSEGEKIYSVFKNVTYPAGTIYTELWTYNSNDEFVSAVDLTYKNSAPTSYTIPNGVSYGYVGFNTKSTSRPISPSIVKEFDADIYIGKSNVNNNTWYQKYIPIVDENKEEIDTIEKAILQNCGHVLTWENKVYSTNGWESSSSRLASNSIDALYDIIIHCETGYKYGVNIFSDESRETRIFDTGWMTSDYVVSAGTSFTLILSKSDNTAILPSDGNKIKVCNMPKLSSFQYEYDGEKLPLEKNGMNVSKMSLGRVTPTIGSNLAMEGGAVFNGKLFQAYAQNVMQIYDIDTATLESEFSITCDHGDCVDFSNDYYADGDMYPLMYVSADTNPAKVYVNRITNSGAELIRTLVFPSSAGYYGGHALDADNNILYLLAYSQQNYQTDDNGNHMIFTSWDLNNLSDNGDNTVTPALIDTFELPFIYTCQDQVFINGRIYVISSLYYATQPTRIYVIDVYSGKITNVLKDFPANITTTELEMISYTENNNKYDIIVGANNGYYNMTFN